MYKSIFHKRLYRERKNISFSIHLRIYDQLRFDTVAKTVLLNLQIISHHLKFFLQCYKPVCHLNIITHGLSKHFNQLHDLRLMIDHSLHPNRLQRIIKKMWIDLTRQHLKLYFFLSGVKLFLLHLLIYHIAHQQPDVLHHLLQFSIKLANFVISLNRLYFIILPLCHAVHLNPELIHTITIRDCKCEDQDNRQQNSYNLWNKCL